MKGKVTLTKQDLAYCRQVFEKEVKPSVEDDSYDGPTEIMTSIGYVGVWSDGDLTYFHTKVGNVGDDRAC